MHEHALNLFILICGLLWSSGPSDQGKVSHATDAGLSQDQRIHGWKGRKTSWLCLTALSIGKHLAVCLCSDLVFEIPNTQNGMDLDASKDCQSRDHTGSTLIISETLYWDSSSLEVFQEKESTFILLRLENLRENMNSPFFFLSTFIRETSLFSSAPCLLSYSSEVKDQPHFLQTYTS